MVKHSNIEKSLYKYISENLEVPYSYAINYGEIRFETNPYDLWLSIIFEEIGAGAKKFSFVRIDVLSRIVGVTFQNDETTALDYIREVFTNVNMSLYDFSSGSPVLVPNEKLLVINTDGRFTVDRILLGNLRAEDLQQNLRRSSVRIRLKLLSDTIKGFYV